MDPNATLASLRDAWDEARTAIREGDDRTAIVALSNLSMHASDLEEWITRGGFLPAWTQGN